MMKGGNLMNDKISGIEQYARCRIQRWSSAPESTTTKAELASLRKGIGKKPGEVPELWGVIFDGLPEDMMSTRGEPTKEEWAIYITLTMYAVHQQGNELGSVNVYKKGETLGRAVRNLTGNDDELERVRKRFIIFATSADIEECAYYLRGLVQMMRSKNIPLDYALLAKDLYLFQTEKGKDSVRLKWGEDFYRNSSKNESEEIKNEK